MAILKNKRKIVDFNKKVIGAYLPQNLSEFLGIYSLAFGKSNGMIIEELIDDLRVSSEYNTEDLLNKIITRCINSYKDVAHKTKFQPFKKKLEAELRRKNLRPSLIDHILKETENGTKE